MDEVIFVEVLGRAGDVVQRHAVARLPATIGRAYDNDVILDDPYAAPHHLRLERGESGELVLVDLDSRNGLFALDPTARVARATARPDARFRVGHTQLRIRPRSYAVPAERDDVARTPWHRKPAALAGLYAAALACVLLYGFASTTERIEPLRLAMPAVWATLGLCVWASTWAFAGKALGARGNFVAHVGIALAALVLLAVVATLGGYAAFAFSSSAIDQGTIVPIAAVLAWTLYRHLILRPVHEAQGRGRRSDDQGRRLSIQEEQDRLVRVPAVSRPRARSRCSARTVRSRTRLQQRTS